MSSDLPSAGPSPRATGTEQGGEATNLAGLLRERGDPLGEARERHRPGAREHGGASAS